tara:strand:+ start:1297 stop:2013 length:717 start_codon:yes stop_codon:yes gene_type:complete
LNADFDQELEDILVGISKIQEAPRDVRSIKQFQPANVIDTLDIEGKLEKLNFSENVRQKTRPEAALWLGMAALVATSKDQSSSTIRLAAKLGGHLARRRARPLGTRFGKNSTITISPRMRGVCSSFLDVGCEIMEIFGVWIKFSCTVEREEIKKIAGCVWPALNFIKRDFNSMILVPRFPERLPVLLKNHDKFGKIAVISEDGVLSFIFWMDRGFKNIGEMSGVAWVSEGVFPIINMN